MAIYLLRHVKTVNNQNNIISGRIDAEILPESQITLIDDVTFDYIYCSTSERCKKTVELVPPYMCKTSVEYIDSLQERSVGFLEGMEKDKALEKYPELFCNNKLLVNAVIEGGEALCDVRYRVKDIVEDIMNNKSGKNVLICSHNQTLKVIYAMLKNIDITDDYWGSIDFSNGKIIEV